jgi:hypothetical protein
MVTHLVYSISEWKKRAVSNAFGLYVEQCLGKDGLCWEYASVLTALWIQKVVSVYIQSRIRIVLVHVC